MEAVAVLEHTRPHVVMMDLRMPDGSGLDALRELRQWNPSRHRLLVLNTYGTDRDTRKAMRAGASGYLLKDAGRDELVRAVHVVAQGPGGVQVGGREHFEYTLTWSFTGEFPGGTNPEPTD